MFAEVATALATLKSLAEIAKLTSDVKTSSEVMQRTAELTGTILALQEKLSALHSDKDALTREKNHLEKQIMEFQKWDADTVHYELKELATGVFAYALKPDCDTSEPPHWLCAHCYQVKQKSILQRTGIDTDGTTYLCPNCKNEFIDHSKHLTVGPSAVAGPRRFPDLLGS